MNTPRNAYAVSTINVNRICVAATTHANGAAQAADGTHLPIGISGGAGRLPPDPNYTDAQVLEAAQAGEVVKIHGPESVGVGLLCAFAWTAGDLLMADADGKGIVATSGKWAAARAESDGVVGQICNVTVLPGILIP